MLLWSQYIWSVRPLPPELWAGRWRGQLGGCMRRGTRVLAVSCDHHSGPWVRGSVALPWPQPWSNLPPTITAPQTGSITSMSDSWNYLLPTVLSWIMKRGVGNFPLRCFSKMRPVFPHGEQIVLEGGVFVSGVGRRRGDTRGWIASLTTPIHHISQPQRRLSPSGTLALLYTQLYRPTHSHSLTLSLSHSLTLSLSHSLTLSLSLSLSLSSLSLSLSPTVPCKG